MKNSITVLLLAMLSLSFSIAHAQVVMGIKGGISSGRLSGFSGNNRVGGHAGLFLHHTINSNWCFQPEILYSGEGQRYFVNGNERTVALEYISVPMMIQFYPIKQLYFETGPQLGILASAQDKGNTVTHINIRDDYAVAQVGLNLGMGVNLTNRAAIYGRYHFGLTDVTRFDNIVDQSQVGMLGIAIRLQ